jgi:tripartite-type tricarboxylate transporter receptor subunit TctC
MVVPNPPGGVDVTLRLVQKDASEDLGQPIVFDYRPGANGFIGTEHVARSPADGYTLLATSPASLVVGPAVTKNAPFDALKDFTPVIALSGGVTVLVVRPTLGASSLKEFVELAKAQPGKLTYGSGGIGTNNHLYAELVNVGAGITTVHVPYKGSGPVIQALLSGEIDATYITVQSVRPLIASGKLKLLATFIGERFPSLPATPDITEALPDFPLPPSWTGVLGPAGVPQAVVMRLHGAFLKAMNLPEVRAKFAEDTRILATTPQQFAAQLRADVARANQIVSSVQRAGVKFE